MVLLRRGSPVGRLILAHRFAFPPLGPWLRRVNISVNYVCSHLSTYPLPKTRHALCAATPPRKAAPPFVRPLSCDGSVLLSVRFNMEV